MVFDVSVGVLAALEIFLSVLVLFRSRTKYNSIFAVFAGVSAFWMLANFIGANFKTYRYAPFFVHCDFVLGVLTVYALWYFSVATLNQVPKRIKLGDTQRRIRTPFLAVVLVAMVMSLSPLVARITTHNGQPLTITYGNGYTYYSIFLGLVVLVGGANLIYAYRKAEGKLKSQLSTMSRGLISGALITAGANSIVPAVTKNESINLIAGNAAYIGIFIFVASTAYAITKHKLFDIRLVVARSIAYAAVILTVSAVYGFIIFGVTQIVFGLNLPFYIQILLAMTTAFVSLSFSYVKRFFDRVTNKIFYSDSYDSQELYKLLNQVLVSTLDIDILLSATANLVATSMKSEYCAFLINGTQYSNKRVISNNSSATAKVDFQGIAKLSETKSIQHVVMTDEIDAQLADSKETLLNSKVYALVQLVLESKHSSHKLGYMILGAKKSGNPYNSQDVQVLEVISNELVIAVQNAQHFEEIQNFNKTLQGKVNEATAKLRTANEKLKALDETKDDFISMASHQLRTPLTSVKGYLSMVMEGDAGKLGEQQKEMLGQAFFSSQRMVYLISDLLNVSRLKTGKFVIDPSPVNLATMVQQELAQLQETAKAKQLTLTYEKPDKFPSLMLDETKTRQVIMNFCDNAIYYTPAGGHIKVEVVDKPNTVELRVVDDGIGVPRSEQHHLFTKFYRAGNARKARPDGTGLGLFMAKKVVVAQGGSIILESTEGKGSTFGFSFNKDKHAVSDKQQQESDKKKAESAV